MQSRRTYFSFTDLTTTGFGDLTPAAAIGRLLAVLEMLLGQLYLVTVISLLVGNLRPPPRHDPERLPALTRARAVRMFPRCECPAELARNGRGNSERLQEAMRAEVLADSDAGRPAISAPAQRSAVRYLAGIAALAALYYGAAQVGYALGLRRPGRRDRVAAGRRRHQLPLPRRPALLAGRAASATCSPTTTPRCRSARRSRRRRATCSRCSPRRCSCAACCAGSAAARQRPRPGPDARRARRRHGGQRDDRHGGAAPRRRRRRRADRARLADLVAGRLRGRPRRRPAGDRLVPSVAPRRLERRAGRGARSSSSPSPA